MVAYWFTAPRECAGMFFCSRVLPSCEILRVAHFWLCVFAGVGVGVESAETGYAYPNTDPTWLTVVSFYTPPPHTHTQSIEPGKQCTLVNTQLLNHHLAALFPWPPTLTVNFLNAGALFSTACQAVKYQEQLDKTESHPVLPMWQTLAGHDMDFISFTWSTTLKIWRLSQSCVTDLVLKLPKLQ